MPDLTSPAVAARVDGRDDFRHAVAALPPGPLRDVLTALAYARDAAARRGTTSAPDDRWRALLAVAERAVRDATPGFALEPVPDAVPDTALAAAPGMPSLRRLAAA